MDVAGKAAAAGWCLEWTLPQKMFTGILTNERTLNHVVHSCLTDRFVRYIKSRNVGKMCSFSSRYVKWRKIIHAFTVDGTALNVTVGKKVPLT